MEVKEKNVDSIIVLKKEHKWINIFGNVWSGKTQLLLLISKKFVNPVWINMKSIGYLPNEICMRENDINVSRLNIVSRLIKSIENIEENSAIFIDDLPSLTRNSELYRFLTQLCDVASKKNICLFTSGNESLKPFTSDINNLYDIEIPNLNVEDVKKILEKQHAPRKLINSNVPELFVSEDSRTPLFIMSKIKILKENNWVLSDEIFSDILVTNPTIIKNELQNYIEETTPNINSRELLYRIAFVGYPISQKCINQIAQISPIIEKPKEIVREVQNIWVVNDNANNLSTIREIGTIAKEYLSGEQKKQISCLLADIYRSKEKLSLIDTTRLLCNLIGAEKYDDAGSFYLEILWKYDKYGKENSFFFLDIWNGIPLPDQMSNDLKCRITVMKLRIYVKLGKELDTIVDRLIEYSKKTKSLYQYLFFASATQGLFADIAMKILSEALILVKNINIIELNLPTNISVRNLMAITGINVKNLSQLRMWFDNFKLANIDFSEYYQEEDILYGLIFYLIEKRVNEALKGDVKLFDDTLKLLNDMLLYAEKTKDYEFYALAGRGVLKLSNSFKEYGITKQEYRVMLKICNKKKTTKFLIKTQMANISEENNDQAFCIQLIKEALALNVNEKYLLEIRLRLHLQLSSMITNEEKNRSIEEDKKALDLVKKSSMFGLESKVRVYGEFITNVYLLREIKSYSWLFYELATVILENAEFIDCKDVICLLFNNITYIVFDIEYNKRVNLLTKPFRSMFYAKNNKQEIEKLYAEYKVHILLIYLAQILHYLDMDKESKEIIRKLNLQKNIIYELENSDIYKTTLLRFPFLFLQTFQCYMFTETFRIIDNLCSFIRKTESKPIQNGYVFMYLYIITVSLINLYIEKNRNLDDNLLKSFKQGFVWFCQKNEDIKMIREYKKIIIGLFYNKLTRDELIDIGNKASDESSELRIFIHLLSTSKIQTNKNTLIQIQVDALMKISNIMDNGNVFYRMIFSKYIKNTWYISFLIKEKFNKDLKKAERILRNNNQRTQGFLDIKKTLRLLIRGYNLVIPEYQKKWLMTEDIEKEEA